MINIVPKNRHFCKTFDDLPLISTQLQKVKDKLTQNIYSMAIIYTKE